ncbi:MAG TPA: sigma-70 family RNA polymerase sigma factor [Candidatus Pullichristensenella avicola]|nr:sigma-70 family RNA polymerase sigma factor [Candidatus Pullichristensenella avicola]
MRNAAQRPPVDAEGLLREYAATGNVAIRDRVVEAHLYIASIIARRFSGRGVDYDDLYQVASLSLLKSVERYDPERGVKFASFVTPTMVGEVKNYFRDRSRLIRLPRRGGELLRAIESARDQLQMELQRQPTAEELARRSGASLEEVLEALEMRGAASPVSLDAMPVEDDESAPLSAFLGREDAGFAEFEKSDMLNRAISSLDERQRKVIRMRFFENKGQREVAQAIGVSQMTVSRVERQALSRLREALTEGENA